MKKLSIILISALVALAACTKSKEVHPEIGDGNDEIVTVGTKDVHVEYFRTDHEELQRVVFHYSLAEAQQFEAAEMTKRETFFELTLNDLLSDTLYYYYFELFYNSGETSFTEQRTFHTQAFDTPEPPTPPSGEYEYVDLGLPSGTLWATCNVGASSQEEYGYYFAWGETEPRTIFPIWDYKYCNGNEFSMTKYCNNSDYGFNGFIDNLVVLESNDDAAFVHWGDEWCMPTKEMFSELLENTTYTWTTINGTNGGLYTASNGNSIFLPAGGAGGPGGIGFLGTGGYYWSSSLDTEEPNDGRGIHFRSDYSNLLSGTRDIGNSIRPVRKTETPPSPGNAHEGAINGQFTININGDKVYFSQGNLQYQASTNTWKFAENQWNQVGGHFYEGEIGNVYENGVKCDNMLVSASYSGWIDMFCWGTSGWDCGNTYYMPYDKDGEGEQYGPLGYSTLTGDFANSDWGVYNAIANGGNQPGLWRTLSDSEWQFIMSSRTNAEQKYSLAVVNGVHGCILLPDEWVCPTGLSFVPQSFDWTTNVYSEVQWTLMELNGAIFLTASGFRNSSALLNYDCCIYQTVNSGSSFANISFFISDNGGYIPSPGHSRALARSVRLVQDANP